MDLFELLRDSPVFSSLSDDELRVVAGYARFRKVAAGELVFKEGERGEEMFVVAEGCVRIFVKITMEVDKTLITLRKGQLFGEMAVISEDYRSASAEALEETELIVISKSDFDTLMATDLAASKKILEMLAPIFADRLKKTTELYWQAVDWGLSISGILDLNYSQLINHKERLVVTLNSGDKVEGILLKAEKNAFGSELLIRGEDDKLVLIPYGSISTITFDKPPARPDEEV